MPGIFSLKVILLVLLISLFSNSALSENETVEPENLLYQLLPQAAFGLNDGSILIFSDEYQSIFIYSVTSQEFTHSFFLEGSPTAITYSSLEDVVYLGYNTGKVNRLDLDSGVESLFANVDQLRILEITAVENYIYILDESSSDTHNVFDLNGELLSEADFSNHAFFMDTDLRRREYVWSGEYNSLFYSDSGGNLGTIEISNTGIITEKQLFPPFDYQVNEWPLRLSPDQNLLLVSSGDLVDTQTYDAIDGLERILVDAQWTDNSEILGAALNLDSGGGDNFIDYIEWGTDLVPLRSVTQASTQRPILVNVHDETYIIRLGYKIPNQFQSSELLIFKWHRFGNDLDGDGVNDDMDLFPVNPLESSDFDEDDIGDNRDTDDDNDGVSDTADAFPFDANETTDSDRDGIGNNADPDDDNDGVNDVDDDFPFNNEESVDTDGDGVGNNADNDDDNDGYADSNDAFPLDESEDKDEDNNGIGDYSETTFTDTDNDGIPDDIDYDDDNDRVPDTEDAFPLDETEFSDRDGDGIADSVDSTPNGEILDSPYISPDVFIAPSIMEPAGENSAFFAIDGNLNTSWTSDPETSFTLVIELGATYFIDRVKINWGVELPQIYSVFLTDENGSNVQNLFTESSVDGGIDEYVFSEIREGSKIYIFTSSEDAPYKLSIAEIEIFGRTSFSDLDTDTDGILNKFDDDDDNDGTDDELDDLPLDSTETTDTDRDGIGNNADTDDDNDGVEDLADAYPLDANRSSDSDGDRVDDSVDADPDTAYGLWQGQERLNPGAFTNAGRPEISMAGDGTAFAIWQETDTSNSEWREKVYTSHINEQGVWSQPVLLDDLPFQGIRNVKIATSSSGSAVAIWVRSLPNEEQYYIAYSEYQPTTGWTDHQAITESQTADYVYPFIDIQFGETDTALFLWATSTPEFITPGFGERVFQLNSREYSSTTGWNDDIEVVAITFFPLNTSDNVFVTNLDINASGQAVLGFSLSLFSGAERSSWFSLYDKNSGWTEPEKFADARNLSNIELNNSGKLMALHSGDVNLGTGRQVESYFVQQYTDSNGWGEEVRVLSQERYGISRPRLAYSDSEHAVIAWHESRGFLNQFARGIYLRPDQQWTQPRTLQQDGFRWGEFSDLAIDNLGNAIVVFHGWDLVNSSNVYANRITPESDWLGSELLYDLNAQGGTDCCPINIEIDGQGNAIAAWAHAGIRANYFKAGIRDFDQDGISDNNDTDDDNDGVNDEADAFPFDANENSDNDGDGVGDNTDTDDDNDGIVDLNDTFPLDASESQDSDGDSIGNNADTDDDNDGVNDLADAFPLDANETVDTDGDGTGNNSDSDDDNDGVNDSSDLFPLNANENSDNDADGIGDNADTDDDNDGVNDAEDAFPFDDSETLDTDSDGTGNNADEDDDNDGMPDEWELLNGLNPVDAGDANQDRDGDGVDNVTEYQNSLNPQDLPEQGGGSTQWPMLLLLLIVVIRSLRKRKTLI